MAGYSFERIGSSASFKLLSYVAFTTFLIQVSVNQLIMRMSKPRENGTTDEHTTKEIVTAATICPEKLI